MLPSHSGKSHQIGLLQFFNTINHAFINFIYYFGESDNLDLATFLLISSLCLKRLEFSFANYFSSFLTLKILFFFLVLIFHSTVLISSLVLLFVPLLNCLYLSVLLLRSSLAYIMSCIHIMIVCLMILSLI